MNPKISIAVDSKNKAVATITGMATVGAKVDVEIRGINPDSIPDWGADDDFVGKSLRLRIVDECGRDLVRFPLVKKMDGGDGDKWTVTQENDGEYVFKTQTGADGSPVVDFNTKQLRCAFAGQPFDSFMSFGVILDSIVDDAQYAVGRVKVKQWSACPTEDPTVLPDWRETLRRLDEDLSTVEQSKADAESAKDAAIVAKNEAVAAKETAQTLANASLQYKNAAAASAEAAATSASSAATSASSAATSATQAAQQVAKYPYVDETTHRWMVWDAESGEFVDTGVSATGPKGDNGDDGITPHIGSNGHWFVGTSDTGVIARGPKGDKGDPGSGADVDGKLPVKPLPKYLHALSFDDPYKADAEAWYESLSPDAMGGACSAVRRGGKLWRNYDWTFDNAAEFVVRMSAAEGRHASVGVASLGAALTEDEVMSGVYTPKYRALPGMTLDGINDAGVVCEINVDGGPKTGWHGDAEDDGIHILAAVRWALDNGETAQQSAEWLADHIIQPTGEMNFHFMVADATKTYIVENGEAHDVTNGEKVLTNYGVFDTAQAGGGKERYQLLVGGADISAVHWTNAYQPGNDWHSDFDSPEQHQSAIEQWAEQGETKEAHRGKTTASGKPWWHTVHTSEYDFAAKTMRVAVQESGEYFTFAVGAKAEVAWGDVKDKPETFPPSAHTHDKIVDGALEVRADLTAKVQSGWTNQWEPIAEGRLGVFWGDYWGYGYDMWFSVSTEGVFADMVGDVTNHDATELTFNDGTPTHRVPATAETQLLTRRDIAAPSTTADTNAVAGAKATGDALANVAAAVAQKRDKTDHVVVPEHWGDFAVGAGHVEPALDGVTPTVAWGEFIGVAGWTITGLANGFEQRFKCPASADATHLDFMVWNDDAESPYYGVSGIIKCDLLSERSYLISGLDQDGVPTDPNVSDFFGESNSLLMARVRYAHSTFAFGASEKLKDRAINALTFTASSASHTFDLVSALPTSTEGCVRDFLIRLVSDAKVTFTTGTMDIRGDGLALEDGAAERLITLTEVASGVWYVRSIDITAQTEA